MSTDFDETPERRSAERHDGQWIVTLRSDGKTYRGSCTNLSTTGMAVNDVEELPIGTIVEAHLEAGGNRHVQVTAEVVRATKPGLLGLRFIAIDSQALMLLLRLLARQP